jgi:predicted ATPase/DNA-binding SARP family transcriptional activator
MSDQGAINLAGARRRALLIRLALVANEVVPAGTLIEDAWDGSPPKRAAATLQSHLSQLRRLIGDERISYRDGGYVLDLADHESEAAQFEADVAEAKRARQAGRLLDALSAVQEGLQRWRGPALADVAAYSWAAGEAARLDGLRAAAVQDWLDLRLELGDHAGVVADAEAAVAQLPFQEGLWASLMLALYRSDRQSDALRAFQRLRRLLGEELGIEPSPAITALEEAVLLQKPELCWRPPLDDAGPVTTVASDRVSRHNLPSYLSSFVGRDQELAELRGLLADHRLVTLVGVGGVGKTRLAVEEARGLVGGCPDGVWLVELANVGDADGLVGAVGLALGIRDPSGQLELVEALRDRQMLLVFDNCEHILEPSAQLVEAIGRECPSVRLLVTSRERLAVEGEQVWRVPSLSLPPSPASLSESSMADIETSGAVALFVARAQAQDPAFRVSGSNADAISNICRRLEGIPLAVELAAAQVRSMSPAEIDRRLDHRFDLLAVSRRGGPSRHQTLEATFQWSWQLLTDVERAVLARLAVFPAGWDLEGGEAVLDEEVEGSSVSAMIASLVDKGLVHLDVGATGDSRYRFLEPVRQFAQQRLMELGDASVNRVRAAHAATYLALAEAAADKDSGPEQAQSLHALGRDYDNLRAALAFLRRQPDGTSAALRLCVALQNYWFYSRRERDSLEVLVELTSRNAAADPALFGRATSLLANCFAYDHKHEAAWEAHSRALELADVAGDQTLRSLALSGLALSSAALGAEPFAVARLADGAVAAARQSGDSETLGRALMRRALSWNRSHPVSSRAAGDSENMFVDFEASTHAFNQAGNWRMLVLALTNWAATENAEGRAVDSTANLERALAIATDLGDQPAVAWVTGVLGEEARCRGDHDRAFEFLRRSIGMFYRMHATIDILGPMTEQAVCLTALGAPRQAALLRGVVARLLAGHDSTLRVISNHEGYEANEHEVQAALGDDEYRIAFDEGFRLTLRQAVELVEKFELSPRSDT